MFSHIVYVSVTCLVLAYHGWIPPENPPGLEITLSLDATNESCPKNLTTLDPNLYDLLETPADGNTTDPKVIPFNIDEIQNYTQDFLRNSDSARIQTSPLGGLRRDNFIHKPRHKIVDLNVYTTSSTLTEILIEDNKPFPEYPKVNMDLTSLGGIRQFWNIGRERILTNISHSNDFGSGNRANGYAYRYGIASIWDQYKQVIIIGYRKTTETYHACLEEKFLSNTVSRKPFLTLTSSLLDSLKAVFDADFDKNQTESRKIVMGWRNPNFTNTNMSDPGASGSDTDYEKDDVTSSLTSIQFGMAVITLLIFRYPELTSWKCRYNKKLRLKHRNGKYLELGLSRHFRYLKVQQLTNGHTTSYNGKIRSDILTAKLDIQRKNMRRNNQVISLFGINNSNVMSATFGRHPFSFLGKSMPVQNKPVVVHSNSKDMPKNVVQKINTMSSNYGCYPLISPWVTLMKSAPGTDDFSTDGKRHKNGSHKQIVIPFTGVTRPVLCFPNYDSFARQLIRLSKDLTNMGGNTVIYEKFSLLMTAYILQRIGEKTRRLRD